MFKIKVLFLNHLTISSSDFIFLISYFYKISIWSLYSIYLAYYYNCTQLIAIPILNHDVTPANDFYVHGITHNISIEVSEKKILGNYLTPLNLF